MSSRILIFVLAVLLLSVFYFNIKINIPSEKEIKNVVQGYVEIKFNENDWKIEDSIPVAKIKKDGKLNRLKFHLISKDIGREIFLEGDFPNGVNYKLIPEKLYLNKNQALDAILEISANKNVKENEIIVKFNGVDEPYKEAKIILENVIEETKEEFKEYKDESGFKVYYPKDFINFDKEISSSLIENATNTKILFGAMNQDESMKIILTKTEVPSFLTINHILLGLKMMGETNNLKILSIKEGNEPIIEEEIRTSDGNFLGKKKLILKNSALFSLDVVSKKEKYKENLSIIDKIIEKSGF